MSDDLISRKALLDRFRYGDKESESDKAWICAVRRMIKEQPTAFDKEKVIEELENTRAQYFITIANTGDEKLGFAYKYIWNALDHAIKIAEKGGIE